MQRQGLSQALALATSSGFYVADPDGYQETAGLSHKGVVGLRRGRRCQAVLKGREGPKGSMFVEVCERDAS